MPVWSWLSFHCHDLQINSSINFKENLMLENPSKLPNEISWSGLIQACCFSWGVMHSLSIAWHYLFFGIYLKLDGITIWLFWVELQRQSSLVSFEIQLLSLNNHSVKFEVVTSIYQIFLLRAYTHICICCRSKMNWFANLNCFLHIIITGT